MKQYLFIHIPKTGGTAVSAWAGRSMPGERIFIGPHVKFLEILENNDLSNYKFIATHFPVYIIHIFPQDTFVFTFLRNPLHRAISAYNHIMRDPRHYAHSILIDNRLTFEESLSHSLLRNHFVNVMTRNLGTDAAAITPLMPASELEAARNALQAMPVDQHTLTRAKANLGNMNFVGFTESINADCRALGSRLGFQSNERIGHENKLPAGISTKLPIAVADAATQAAMERWSPYDFELYHHALRDHRSKC